MLHRSFLRCDMKEKASQDASLRLCSPIRPDVAGLSRVSMGEAPSDSMSGGSHPLSNSPSPINEERKDACRASEDSFVVPTRRDSSEGHSGKSRVFSRCYGYSVGREGVMGEGQVAGWGYG